MNKSLLLMLIALCLTSVTFSQRAQYEDVSYFDVKTPNNPFDASIKTYNVVVETPYTLTVEELNAKSLADFEVEKANYANVVKQSEEDFQTQLANHAGEVKQAEAHYDKEMADFKALSLLERLALTDQGKKPQLKVPSKPVYVKPREPIYTQPNLNEHLIFDNNVLADGLELSGYEKGGDVLFAISISKMVFQDNAGKTFYSQPTNLKVMKGTELIAEKNFDDEFQFLTSSSSNTINLDSYEKSNVNKIMANISQYINEEFGYVPFSTTIRIEFPKNKNREYDALENAKIKAVSAYRKLKKDASSETRTRAIEELKAVRETWKAELAKVNYTDKKAVMNNEVAKIIFFNLMRVDISLKDKAQAEETLSALQEKRIDLNLSYDEKAAFTRLEEEIYKLN